MFLDCETVSNPLLLIQQKYSKSTAEKVSFQLANSTNLPLSWIASGRLWVE